MADLVINAADVLPAHHARRTSGTAGATVTQGQAVYVDQTDSTYKPASAADPATARAFAVALTAAYRGQPIEVQHGGRITIGAEVSVGEIYVVSANPGGIAPAPDLAAGHYVTIIGVGVSPFHIEMPAAGPFQSGVAVGGLATTAAAAIAATG